MFTMYDFYHQPWKYNNNIKVALVMAACEMLVYVAVGMLSGVMIASH